jgi:acyl dehydratase
MAVRATHAYRAGKADGHREHVIELETDLAAANAELDDLRAELASSSEQIIAMAAAGDPFVVHLDHELTGGASWN